MDREYLIHLGFEELPNFTVMNSLTFQLGRNRYLSFGCIGTPNEMLFLCEHYNHQPDLIESMITIHNYDYNGLMTKAKLESLLFGLTGKKFKING